MGTNDDLNKIRAAVRRQGGAHATRSLRSTSRPHASASRIAVRWLWAAIRLFAALEMMLFASVAARTAFGIPYSDAAGRALGQHAGSYIAIALPGVLVIASASALNRRNGRWFAALSSIAVVGYGITKPYDPPKLGSIAVPASVSRGLVSAGGFPQGGIVWAAIIAGIVGLVCAASVANSRT